MGDYGFRISEEGKDVKTCEDRECVLTSKYSVAKGGLSATGNITASGDPSEGTLTINHNLGFIPVVRIFMLSEGEYIEIPETEWGAGYYIFDVYYEHTSVNQIVIYASLWIDGETASLDLDFTYYISNEKVNI
jgi:hypothetical protein